MSQKTLKMSRKERKRMDVMHRAAAHRIHELSKDAVYFGVCFPTDFVLLASLRASLGASQGTGFGGILDDEKCVDFLLREPFDPAGLCRHFE